MSLLPLIITDVGVAAAVAADGQGLQLDITQIALGSGDWSPGIAATALNTEVKRLSVFGATVLAPDRIHVTIRDDSADVYDLREIGLYDENGDLFAIYAQSAPIVSKSADAKVLLTATIPLTTVPPASVTITGNEFDYSAASESVAGVAEIATQSEVDTGADDLRIVTPQKLKRRLTDLLSGSVVSFAMDSPPSGFLECDGSAISRTTYADLFAAIGTTYGVGDGSTTFAIPDLRGEFIRGWDNGRGVDSGRALGSFQQATAVGGYTKGTSGSRVNVPVANSDGSLTITTGDYRHLPASTEYVGPTENAQKVRPRNIAMMYCIKY